MSSYAALSANAFFEELQRIISTLVWKNDVLANELDAALDPKPIDLYMNACRGSLTFSDIRTLHESSISPYITDQNTIKKYMERPGLVPMNLRANILEREMIAIEKEYVELNNYYRQYCGLPDTNDTEFFYNYLYDDIPKDIPIHELDYYDRYLLEAKGFFEILLKENPTKTYIKYIASQQCKPYNLRELNKYSIINLGLSNPDVISKDFEQVYNECRDYMIRVHYNSFLRKENNYYEQTMGMLVLFMTIQRMCTKYLETDIDREFYDLDSLKLVYESYGVPYIEQAPLYYHKLLVKKLNIINSFKGSDKCLIDLTSLLNFTKIHIFQYYLTKNQRWDYTDNVPQFVHNDDGTINNELTYPLDFVEAPIQDNPYSYIVDFYNNRADYLAMTEPDPYWFNDKQLYDKIYEHEFNFIETKYLGVKLLIDLTRLMFEQAYFLKMLVDKKDKTQTIVTNILIIDKEVPLFTIVIWLYAAICHKYEWNTDIPLAPTSIGKILGFNIKADLRQIRQHILDSKLLDNKLADMILKMDINSLEDVDIMFDNLLAFREFIQEQRWTTTDKETFDAYTELYKIVMTVDYMPEIFTKRNGEIASSYKELLMDLDYELYNKLYNYDVGLEEDIFTVLKVLENLASDVQYLQYTAGVNLDIIVRYLYKLIAHFKSVRTDLTQFSIIYTFNSPFDSMIKFLMDMESCTIHADLDNEPLLSFIDMIYQAYVNDRYDEFFKLAEKVLTTITEVIPNASFRLFTTTLGEINMTVWGESYLTFDEVIESVSVECVYTPNDKINPTNYKMYVGNEHFEFDDRNVYERVDSNIKSGLTFSDTLKKVE